MLLIFLPKYLGRQTKRKEKIIFVVSQNFLSPSLSSSSFFQNTSFDHVVFLFRSDKDGDRSAASSIKGIKIIDDLDDWFSEHSKDNGASSKKNNNTTSRNSLISTSSDMTGTASAWDELYDRLRATGEIDVENGTHV